MDMEKKKILPAAMVLTVCFRLVSAASADMIGVSAGDEEFKSKIEATAKALGTPVYEDFPAVRFEKEYSAKEERLLFNAVSDFGRMQTFSVPVPEEAPEKFESSFWDRVSVAWHGAGFVFTFIGSQIMDSGILPWTEAAPSFEEISEKTLSKARNSRYASRSGGFSLLENEGFIKEFENATGSVFIDGNMTDYLIDGPESFSMKDRLFKNAEKTIYVASWAFYDDITGKETADLLIRKKNEGVDVKVIVDAKVLGIHGARVIGLMEKNGIEVLRFRQERSADVWHVKMIIVDGEYAIVGGMNFGDPYSHRGGGPKWRDTEILFSGPAVAEAGKIFAENWNDSVAKYELPLPPVSEPARAPAPAGNARISVVLQDPPEDSRVFLSMLKGMYGATREINVENAYFVAVPAVIEALSDALDRGVEVNILTNSAETLNGQCRSMSVPLLKSLAELLEKGANVYLQQGRTLHSKFMTVDGVFANIGSYNLHPRGERYDTELNVNVLGREAVEELDDAFYADLAAAERIHKVKDLGIKDTWLSRIIEEYFLAQLSP